MNIQNQINTLIARSPKNYGRPKSLYLGRQEYKALYAWIEHNFQITVTEETIDNTIRPKFAGMEIYKVDAESHIDVGNYTILP